MAEIFGNMFRITDSENPKQEIIDMYNNGEIAAPWVGCEVSPYYDSPKYYQSKYTPIVDFNCYIPDGDTDEGRLYLMRIVADEINNIIISSSDYPGAPSSWDGAILGDLFVYDVEEEGYNIYVDGAFLTSIAPEDTFALEDYNIDGSQIDVLEFHFDPQYGNWSIHFESERNS